MALPPPINEPQPPPPPPQPPLRPGRALLGGEPLGSTDLNHFERAGPHPQQPSKFWALANGDKPSTAPLPTNAWWINLALSQGEDLVTPLPYLVKARPAGLEACLPQNKDAASDYVLLPFASTVVFGAKELSTTSSHGIVGYDSLSVQLQWRAAGDSGGCRGTS